MSLLNEEIRQEVKAALADVKTPVTLKVFTQRFECQYCKETRELAQEVAELNDRLSVEVYDFEKDKAIADSLGIDKVPAIAIIGAKDYGIRMFGIPSGYEFGSLIEAIRLASAGDSGLAPETRKQIARLQKDMPADAPPELERVRRLVHLQPPAGTRKAASMRGTVFVRPLSDRNCCSPPTVP